MITAEHINSFLPFLSTLIWQIIVAIVIWVFRSELCALLRRIAKVKHGETELTFQESSPNALEPSPVATEALQIRDEEGFFTSRGIEDLVQRSKYLVNSESLRDSILVFKTPEQHTWLIATDQQIFFVLDDEDTRSSQRLIQHRLPLQSALPVSTKQKAREVGVFQLGTSDWWYYSMDILGKPPKAKQRLEVFVKTILGK
jgi:hypothetical protein